jgi:hypothetical protein
MALATLASHPSPTPLLLQFTTMFTHAVVFVIRISLLGLGVFIELFSFLFGVMFVNHLTNDRQVILAKAAGGERYGEDMDLVGVRQAMREEGGLGWACKSWG